MKINIKGLKHGILHSIVNRRDPLIENIKQSQVRHVVIARCRLPLGQLRPEIVWDLGREIGNRVRNGVPRVGVFGRVRLEKLVGRGGEVGGDEACRGVEQDSGVGGDVADGEVAEDVDDLGPLEELVEALGEEDEGEVEGEVHYRPQLLAPGGQVVGFHPVEVDEEDEVDGGCRRGNYPNDARV